MPIPSPRAYPFARESKEKQRLSGLKNPSALRPHCSSGSKMRLAPPTSAQRVGQLVDRIVSQARCKAAMELEHAVSQVTDGPRRLLYQILLKVHIKYMGSATTSTYKNQLMRFDSIERDAPVFAYFGAACMSRVIINL
jgi:hypothetical protein